MKVQKAKRHPAEKKTTGRKSATTRLPATSHTPFPHTLAPMLATLVDKPFDAEGWSLLFGTERVTDEVMGSLYALAKEAEEASRASSLICLRSLIWASSIALATLFLRNLMILKEMLLLLFVCLRNYYRLQRIG